MPDQITTAFVQEYKATVDLLLQQEGSRFRPTVTQDSYVGKAGSAVEQFGAVAAQKRTSRHEDTPNLEVPQAKRWVHPEDYVWASLIDDIDRLRMIVDPTGPYARNGANAMARAQDDEIIQAFFAASVTGENGTDSEAFDTANFEVPVVTGGTASSLNVAKLQEAMRMLMSAHRGDVMERVYCAISSFEHDALLKEIQVTSGDFNGGIPTLVNGRVKHFMGMDFIITERLEDDGTNRFIPVWVETGMHMGIWSDTMAKVSERDDKNYAFQVWLAQTIGATRLQQGKVVRILCDDQV